MPAEPDGVIRGSAAPSPPATDRPSAASDRPSATSPETGPGPAPAGREKVGGTRVAHTWVALAAAMFFLVVVLVFILQNLRSVRVHFFWATWTIPLAVDLLLATVLGGLIMFAAGSLRIVQLRRVARRAGRPR